MPKFIHPFSPFIDESSTTLILGTFPSIKSFENNFYYTHPKNQFWKLLAGVFDEETPKNLEEKRIFLQKHHIALWDIIQSCKRENSSDTNLKDITPNDIKQLLQNYPNIQQIFFTSKTAQKIYQKNFSIDLPIAYLPSPSPAYAVLSFEEKLNRWKEIF